MFIKIKIGFIEYCATQDEIKHLLSEELGIGVDDITNEMAYNKWMSMLDNAPKELEHIVALDYENDIYITTDGRMSDGLYEEVYNFITNETNLNFDGLDWNYEYLDDNNQPIDGTIKFALPYYNKYNESVFYKAEFVDYQLAKLAWSQRLVDIQNNANKYSEKELVCLQMPIIVVFC